ncbi:MAG: hypothetical protein U0934_18245 [Pseudotabrizicola sp.]|uniref:baeRF11 domain-containing protein n=1 Tax=Pseudotabrizicola sp. TaxID=2939647 RepID=UPI00272420DC|nr:hypothetical protein [Pseudotabrizicola sp.]MDO8885085.1 hypothetical protein [Pseudotabrizicola sp.]MDP2083332.1 hypothetical protein [Pseudotabrizicola sp.]MDZ7575865.1 hypothetical protein [Pseudotabrizicola sp.]
MLYVDIPTKAQIDKLIAARGDALVSFFIPTTPETQHIGQARTTLGNLLKDAEAQLEAVGTAKRTIWPISEQINDLLDDDDFWAKQANSLAVFVSPDRLRTYRLPNHLTEMVQVGDRYFIKPLLRSVSGQNHAFVLALAENEVRLIEVFADLPPIEVRVPDMPKDAASAAGTSNVNSRSYSKRTGGSEGQNALLRSYCRKIDDALRPVLAGRDEPLIIAATDPLLSMFRTVTTHDHIAEDAIKTSPMRMTPAELATGARPVLDAVQAKLIASLHERFEALSGEGRSLTDVADVARAATFGAVDTLFVDIDGVLPGSVDETTGAVTFDKESTAANMGVVDEIAGRVIVAGGSVVAVRKDDIPGKGALAAILRYSL